MSEFEQIKRLSWWLDAERLKASVNTNNIVPYTTLLNLAEHQIRDTNINLVINSFGLFLSGLLLFIPIKDKHMSKLPVIVLGISVVPFVWNIIKAKSCNDLLYEITRVVNK